MEQRSMMQSLKTFIKWALAKYGYQIKPLPKGKPKINPFWDEDTRFNEMYCQLEGCTLLSKQRCYMLYQFVKQVHGLPGEVAEVGVYKGGTAKLIASALEQTNKSIHIFDTFSGMPPTDAEKDVLTEGFFGDTSLKSVKEYLSDCKNVFFYQGLFPETSKPIENEIFCLVHIDVDIYKSVMDCCEFYYDRMQKGGIMIFDDYGDRSCPGAKMAVDEFFENKAETPCYLTTGQCIVMRL